MSITTKLRTLFIVSISTIIFSCGAKVADKSTSDSLKVAEQATGSIVSNVTNDEEIKILMKTTAGDITVLLYNETPLHKANFMKLVKEKFYNGILFHRVIKEFMIQAGDPDSKTAKKGQMLGSGGPAYMIDAEFNTKFIHKKGALSAARQGDNVNPQKKSSGSQFYIVQGKKYTDSELQQMETQMEMQTYAPLVRKYLSENPKDMAKVQKMQNEKNQKGLQTLVDSITNDIKLKNPNIVVEKYTDEQRKIYKTLGGTPFLDRNYTVFGEVVEGLEIIDKIAAVQTNAQDRPIDDVRIISMEILK